MKVLNLKMKYKNKLFFYKQILRRAMDYSSEFIKDKALFGSYPSQENIEDFENIGVRYFIDLTCPSDNLTPYTTRHKYIKYSIPDQKVPTNWKSFSHFIISISDIILSLKDDEKIYIHCKGGHGRSGVVVSCILCYMYNISPQEALETTSSCHFKRKIMKEKWRKIGSPQTRLQKNFVFKFFEPLYVCKNIITQCLYETSNDNIHLVINKNFKESKTVENSTTQNATTHNTTDDLKTGLLCNILKEKSGVQNYLLTTGLRPIFVMHQKDLNPFVSKAMTKVREDLYKTIIKMMFDLVPQKQEQYLNYQRICMAVQF
jgi:protein-tyrosine phosphatase